MDFENNIDYLDQHFLVDKSIVNSFIDICDLKPEDIVVEIGPGKGQISEIVARKVNHLTCIEIDRNLESYINVLQDKYNNVDIVYGNALNVFIPECDKIISCLPYSITEPFIEKLLRCNFESAVLIVGKKFADNVINKEHNKLSLLTNSFFNIEKICDITPDAFDPSPRVMSSMIRLFPVSRQEVVNDYKRFIFREMFFNRDRKLKNNLKESIIEYAKLFDKKLTKKEAKSIVVEFNIPDVTLNKLMENLTNEEFDLIYNNLK